MKKDITSRKDIEILMQRFYQEIKTDRLLGPLFTEVLHINWKSHIVVMCDFWENAIFYTGSYSGNPMDLHKHLHKAMPLLPEHFQQWNFIFMNCTDELFTGPNALLAKQRTFKISNILQEQIITIGK